MKKNESHITDDLLVKYLLDEANIQEQADVQEWIKISTDNQRYFNHFKLIWEQSKTIAVKSTVDENVAWERFKQRTQQPTRSSKTIEIPGQSFNWIRAAAIILLLVTGAGFIYKLVFQKPAMIVVCSENNVLIDTLPDGSVVTLNKHAELSYPEEFAGDTRLVTLQGEAFFNVTPNKKQPFTISANDAKIRVVGTSFNVKSNVQKTEVIVATGIVEVSKTKYTVKLNPNESAIVNKDKAEPLKKTNSDELYNYYRTKEFVCNGTPLWRLTDVLNDAYGVNIIIADNRLKNLLLTTTFRNEPLDNILAVIGETFNIKIERNGSNIILR